MSQDRATAQTIKALIRLIHDGRFRERFGDEQQAPAVLEELGLPAAVEPEVRLFLDRWEAKAKSQTPPSPPRGPATVGGGSGGAVDDTRLEAFSRIRRSFQVAIGMSILLLLMGAVMLMAAFFRSLSESQVSTS